MPKQRVSLKGKGADLFFGEYTPDPSPTPSADEPTALLAEASPGSDEIPVDVDAAPLLPLAPEIEAPAEPPRSARQARSARQSASVLASRSASTLLRSPASTPTSEVDSSIADSELETIALLRRQVRLPGKEVSFTRLTIDEKRRLADIVHHFKQQGQKTSENEINRIAINAMLHDYDMRGEASLLARVLAALLA